MNIYIDIETLPTDDSREIAYIADTLKAPAQYKKPKSIERWIADNRQDVIEKTALSGQFGRVYMIGYAVQDESPQVIRGTNEIEVLTDFRALLTELGVVGPQGDMKAVFIGHNAKDFDLPFLSQRMMINGLGPLWRHETKPPVYDTMGMFACGRYKQYYSLESLCLAFGIESPKSDLDGSKVYQYFKDGRHDEVAKYCADDVAATRQLYLAMTKTRMAA